jgi:hypothetical protein
MMVMKNESRAGVSFAGRSAIEVISVSDSDKERAMRPLPSKKHEPKRLRALVSKGSTPQIQRRPNK